MLSGRDIRIRESLTPGKFAQAAEIITDSTKVTNNNGTAAVAEIFLSRDSWGDNWSKEGGFKTRPYESGFFFALFAPFAVNYPIPNLFFGCGSAALGSLRLIPIQCRRKKSKIGGCPFSGISRR